MNLEIDFSKYRFRCSKLGDLMTESRSKNETLSETTKGHLDAIFIKEVFGREQEITSKFLEKGNFCEEFGLSLLSNYKNKLLVKNKDHFQNLFIKGTPDIIEPEIIDDTKLSWDLWTFHRATLSNGYEWQLRGYMELTGKKKAHLCYCLVDCPEHILIEEERRMSWKKGFIDTDSEAYHIEAAKLRKNLTFGDIPEKLRVKIFEIEHSDEKINALYSRINDARKYLIQKLEDLKQQLSA